MESTQRKMRIHYVYVYHTHSPRDEEGLKPCECLPALLSWLQECDDCPQAMTCISLSWCSCFHRHSLSSLICGTWWRASEARYTDPSSWMSGKTRGDVSKTLSHAHSFPLILAFWYSLVSRLHARYISRKHEVLSAHHLRRGRRISVHPWTTAAPKKREWK